MPGGSSTVHVVGFMAGFVPCQKYCICSSLSIFADFAAAAGGSKGMPSDTMTTKFSASLAMHCRSLAATLTANTVCAS